MSRLKTNGIFNENRCNIFNFIVQNPGKHFGEIKRKLNLTKRGLGYHLEKMLDEGLISIKPHGIFKFYYPSGMELPSKVLTPMQQKIFELIKEESCTTRKIAEIMKKSERSIDYHVNNMNKLGFIIKKKRKGKGVYWHVITN